MTPEQIQFIYFDLDDTLLDHRQAERRGLADVYRAHEAHFSRVSVDILQDTYHAHSTPLWRQYAQGEIGKNDLKRLRFERTLQTLGIDGLDAATLNAFYLDCYARHWTFPQHAREAFHALADRFPVGILTNGFAEIQHAKFNRFPELRDRAAALIVSEEVGYMKPHPKIFAHAGDIAQKHPEAILYVGDSYSSDVQGALWAGWQVAWYTTKQEVPDEAVFRFGVWDELTTRLLGD
ncbi:MAG: HAD family hydrolase [Rhodothermales bacterium]